jgi:hypothetical protein
MTRRKLNKPRIQEPDEPEDSPFKVGEWARPGTYWHGHRLALPASKWPSPGSIASPAVSEKHSRESKLRFDAQTKFDDLLCYYKINFWEGGCPTENEVGIQDRERRAAENRKFLHGCWQSFGFEIPSDETIERWALEGFKKC